ncbi:mas-related G-protein coupled receptor member H-like [Eublepharis macularius]|uniref:Mas-related G-protein coupled receptor member H-like n=1 Tax=Eublepharis macularius TaxID=481883 RepID=A0AA97JRM7_EUBMA|nr:mas-related G-protein coupled receptor member H-like [Eublepharis macularius]
MINISNTSILPEEDKKTEQSIYDSRIFCIFLLCMCIIGLLGNGMVIHLLGFRIKRSPFTTYILNLAVADFGVLLFVSARWILILSHRDFSLLFPVPTIYASFMYVTSQFLLTAISVDKCVSVLFPIWYRCHRPMHWSTTVCALIWVLISLPTASSTVLWSLDLIERRYFFYPYIVSSFLCLPLVTVSTVILLFKVSCKFQQPQRRRLLTIILLTLLFFLIFGYPLGIIYTYGFLNDFKDNFLYYVEFYGYLCACLNSFVNPVIYYMVGRKKKAQRRETLKVILQRVFKEEEEAGEEGGTTAQTEP